MPLALFFSPLSCLSSNSKWFAILLLLVFVAHYKTMLNKYLIILHARVADETLIRRSTPQSYFTKIFSNYKDASCPAGPRFYSLLYHPY